MGLNKNHFTKSKILSFLKEQRDIDALERDIKIKKIFSSECTISDIWSANFLNDLNKTERQIRKDYFESNPIFTDANLAEKMISRAETLISFYFNNENTFDLLVAINLLINSKTTETLNYAKAEQLPQILLQFLIDSFEK